MKPSQPKTRYQAIISAILSIVLVASLVPGQALAETTTGDVSQPQEQTKDQSQAQTQAPTQSQGENNGQSQGQADKKPTATDNMAQAPTDADGEFGEDVGKDPTVTEGQQLKEGLTNEESLGAESLGVKSQSMASESNDGSSAAIRAQAQVEEPHDIKVTVGLPSESNVKQDLQVELTYNDKFFEKPSATFNNDLAYASTCLAASADNSNEGDKNYSLKSKNIVSFLQQIGCEDVTTNDGYNYKPMEKANIGVAIGHKDIRLNNTTYRLFVFGIRGGGYEEEWSVNMRVGTEGDATGFQEARDGALGFIMPYIKKHTDGLDGTVNVKIWGSGYCRGGTTTNMAVGWLNKWIYERNNGAPYKPYTQNYNAEHTVYGNSYSKADGRYTQTVSFSPAKEGGYLASNVQITQDDVYAYPVNCPFGADGTDVENHKGFMKGIHNLINPDDWFPQVVMDWWGFKRYGYEQDHDITGTYATDGDLHKRDKSVWDPTNATRKNAVTAMISRLKAVDNSTAFNSTYFRQRYFSKASVVTNTFKKVGLGIWNGIKKLFGKKTDPVPDIFQISIDEKGEGNQFYSKGKEIKYNQGGYYQEFMKFLLNSAGFPTDAAGARKHYVENYQDAFFDLTKWALGQPLEIREKFSKVGKDDVKTAFKQMQDEGYKQLTGSSPVFKAFGVLTNSTVGTWLSYITAAVWAVNDSSAAIPAELINRTLKLVFGKLGISYTDAELTRASKAVAKLAYNFYDKEQSIAKFCLFHALTMYKAGSSIAQSHWPEQSLAWFAQCKPSTPAKKEANVVKAQAEALGAQADTTTHEVFAVFDDDPTYFYVQGSRTNGEAMGIIDTPESYSDEDTIITSWNMYDFKNLDDFIEGNPPLKTITEDYEITSSDPAYIVLTPNVETVRNKHVRLWLNQAMTGFDKDVLIGEFVVYDGGYHYIAYTNLPEGISDEGFDVTYYGDNENLVRKEGVTLQGWVTEAANDEEMVSFLPDDFIDYGELPDGDTVDLYAAWLDPVAYGIKYHANRSDSDSYVVEDAQLASDDSKLTITGLAENDEGMQNPGKTFVGWNTKPDGSGTWIAAGEQATLAQLNLGDRGQYLQDLQALADLQTTEAPVYNTGDDSSDTTAADDLETKLEDKYTVDLYAQWDGPAATPAATPVARSTATQAATSQKTPSTSDSSVPPVVIVLALAGAAVSLAAARRLRKD